MTSASFLQKGMELAGKAGRNYMLSAPLIQRKHPHVWRAIRWGNEKDQVVIKHLQPDDNPEKLWPAFQKEIDMQTRFQSAKFIRKMIDIIPASSNLTGHDGLGTIREKLVGCALTKTSKYLGD